jgi:hypothetical protein
MSEGCILPILQPGAAPGPIKNVVTFQLEFVNKSHNSITHSLSPIQKFAFQIFLGTLCLHGRRLFWVAPFGGCIYKHHGSMIQAGICL